MPHISILSWRAKVKLNLRSRIKVFVSLNSANSNWAVLKMNKYLVCIHGRRRGGESFVLRLFTVTNSAGDQDHDQTVTSRHLDLLSVSFFSHSRKITSEGVLWYGISAWVRCCCVDQCRRSPTWWFSYKSMTSSVILPLYNSSTICASA